ncbi:HDOD domain-containing protein [Actinotalea sp.]|uniref:EAL and HDOD domain-containing protein n=1 Tax=Actinotalea sp. TaxID=1872145 RepID=UPI002C8C5FC9|nr:HDOD domain-containing protein [Actinotalea sp.]HRA51685.1 HDOD domain-containing protein [Actinotalea sp.]
MPIDLLHPRRGRAATVVAAPPTPVVTAPQTPGVTLPLTTHDATVTIPGPQPTGVGTRLHREPIVAFDGHAIGYTVTLDLDVPHPVPAPHAPPGIESFGYVGAPPAQPVAAAAEAAVPRDTATALHESYLALDLPNLVADRYAFLPATAAMIDGDLPRPPSAGRLVLDLPPGFELTADAGKRAARLRGRGVELCLPGYRGGALQDALLPVLDFVTVHTALLGPPSDVSLVDRPAPALADLVARLHARGTRVLAEDIDPLTAARCRVAGVDALRGAATPPVTDPAPRVLRAGQLQCLAVMHLLHQQPVELGKVSEVVDTDPVLTVRVLHLVNSGAFSLRRGIDTVAQAVVLLGPRELTTLVATLALEARPGAMDSLWRILARALTCEAVSDDPASYTVGLLSALIEELGVPTEAVLDIVGVSSALAGALRAHEGPLGRVLAAVLAHERRDYAGVLALGLAPMRVSDAYVRCLANALATARAVSPA